MWDALLRFNDARLEADFWASAQVKSFLRTVDMLASVLIILNNGSIMYLTWNMAASHVIPLLMLQTQAFFTAVYLAIQAAVLYGMFRHDECYYRRYRDIAMIAHRGIRILNCAVLSAQFAGDTDISAAVNNIQGRSQASVVYQASRTLAHAIHALAGWPTHESCPRCRCTLNWHLHDAERTCALTSRRRSGPPSREGGSRTRCSIHWSFPRALPSRQRSTRSASFRCCCIRPPASFAPSKQCQRTKLPSAASDGALFTFQPPHWANLAPTRPSQRRPTRCVLRSGFLPAYFHSVEMQYDNVPPSRRIAPWGHLQGSLLPVVRALGAQQVHRPTP